MSDNEDDMFYHVGDLVPHDARKILPRLEEERIRFQIDTDFQALEQLPAAAAGCGTWGSASKIKLYLHRDDEKKFRSISGEFFKI